MLKKEMVAKLNKQINLEFFSANLYLQISAWCEQNAFQGAAAFFKAHSTEEMEHMYRMFRYVNDSGVIPILGAVEAPTYKYASLIEVFKKTYEHEKLVTEQINQLAHLAMTTQDYATFNFLQWYIAEQHEEEHLFKGILDKMNLIVGDGEPLFFIDRELAEMSKQ